MNSKVVIYACGGAGINIASMSEHHRKNEAESGFAKLEQVYIDTSRSNLRNKQASQDFTYLIEGLDGSGYVRAQNHEPIQDAINPILHKFKPGYLNIVISSLSGGSGSVIAPELVSELLARDENVIVIGIGSSESAIETENTLKSLKSYARIAEQRDNPVVMEFIDNAVCGRKEADEIAYATFAKLSSLFSGQHHELDSADLRNWLRFQRVTRYQPTVASLRCFADPQETKDQLTKVGGSIITLATLYPEGYDGSVDLRVGYRCRGYVSPANQEFIKVEKPMNFAICDGDIGYSIKHFSNLVDQYEEELTAARRSQKSYLSEKDKPTKSGLIL